MTWLCGIAQNLWLKYLRDNKSFEDLSNYEDMLTISSAEDELFIQWENVEILKSLPVLKVGIPVLLNGAVPDYYLARLQIAWHIGLLKMTVSGVIVCLIYMIIMFIIKKKLNSKTSRNSQP